MTTEQMIEAQSKWIVASNTAMLQVCVVLFVAGLIFTTVCFWLWKRDTWSDWCLGAWIGGVLTFFVGLLGVVASYEIENAQLRARANLSNYQLIEIRK